MKTKTETPEDQLRRVKRELRELRQQALIACLHLKAATAAIDVAMAGPSTVDRGEKIGKIATNIDFIKDSLWHFGLGRPLPMRYKSRKRLAENGGGK